MKTRPPLLDPWVWTMAWRDSRSHRRKLLLFLSCIVLGVAALVAIRSLGHNLETAVDAQSRTLLGADLVIRSRRAFTPETETLLDSLGGDQSREIRFASMVYFPKNGGTRLVQVRALAGGFPYYGALETDPPEAARTYRETGGALLDDGLLLQFDIQVGDSVRIGTRTFRIAGRLRRIPGEAIAAMTVAPRVYIPLPTLESTRLIQHGSLATYLAYFKLDEARRVDETLDALKPHLDANGLRSETVESRQRRLGRVMGNLYLFLSLVGFVALLLGCVGIASAVHVYIRQKLNTVAVLRCLGAQSARIFPIYLIQIAGMGLIGAASGALLGLGVQRLLPAVIGFLLPLQLNVSTSWPAIAEGIFVGLVFALLFALLPLLPVRRISPLRTLRASYEEDQQQRDPARIGLIGFICALICALSIAQTGRWTLGLGLVAGLAAAFGLLSGVAFLLMKTVRRYFPASWRYTWRQGLANLYRPQNQTLILVLSLGLGTFLIATLYIAQHSLLAQVSLAGTGTQPNLVFFDVQTDQVADVARTVRSSGLPVHHQVPVVTMRLASVKNRDVRDILNDPDRGISRWALTREYRSTYRDHLFDSERLLSGEWTPRVENGTQPVPVSLEADIAHDLNVALGDTLVFDVQGIPVSTTVASLREVDWQRVQPNFFVVFPAGVLEPAPQFFVLTTRVRSEEESARLQRTLVRRHPNISAIDLGLILQTVDTILSQVGFVIRFMALFSILTGLTVLVSAVLTSRYQRVQESVLLRTLGASRRQIVQILLLEYLFLGGLAALTGLILSLGGSWALARFAFEVAFAVPLPAILAIFALVTAVTVALGMLSSRGIASRPPLEVLRNEA